MNKHERKKVKMLERQLRRASKNAAHKNVAQYYELPFGRKPGGCHKSGNIYSRNQKHRKTEVAGVLFCSGVEMGHNRPPRMVL